MERGLMSALLTATSTTPRATREPVPLSVRSLELTMNAEATWHTLTGRPADTSEGRAFTGGYTLGALNADHSMNAEKARKHLLSDTDGLLTPPVSEVLNVAWWQGFGEGSVYGARTLINSLKRVKV